MRRSLLALLAAGALVFGPGDAHATKGEQELWLGVDGTTAPDLGASARYRYALSDFWAVGATAQHRFGAAGFTAAMADARLTIDALTFVPSVAVGAGVAWRGEMLPAARVEGSLAWRPARTWAVALRLGVEQVGLASTPTPFVSLAWGWIRGAASGLDF